MSNLKEVRIRRLISITSSLAIAAMVSLPAISIRPDLIGEVYYLGLLAVFVLLSGLAIHNSLIGPAIFSYASVEAPGIRRAIDRLVPKTNPIFRVSPRSTNVHVQVEQYLWNGWAAIHQDRQFESINSMQLYVRDANARSQPFIGPEFTGDDLLVIDGDGQEIALSMRHAERYTERARDEANQARRSLWSRRMLYSAGTAGAVVLIGYGLSIWRTQPIGGRVLPLTLEQIVLGCGALGSVAIVAAFSYATRETRRRWWSAVKQGSRYVRYRVVREAHEDRYFVQAYSASEWRTKSHINGLDMFGVEKALESEVRELRRIVASNHAAAEARAARERLIAPFAVEGARGEALIHEQRNRPDENPPALIEMMPDSSIEGVEQSSHVPHSVSEPTVEAIAPWNGLLPEGDLEPAPSDKVRPIRPGHGYEGTMGHASLRYPAR